MALDRQMHLCNNAVGQLITHRAGLSNGPFPDTVTETDPSRARYHFAKIILNTPRVAEPGTNTNYAPGCEILGVMLEILAHKPLEELMKTEIFDRFGMSTCALDEPLVYNKNADIPWGYSAGNVIIAGPNLHQPAGARFYACGAVYGSVADLGKYYSELCALRNGGGLGLPAEFYTQALSFPTGAFYTYSGLASSTNNILSHGGGTDRGQIIGLLNFKTGRCMVLSTNSCRSDIYDSMFKRCLAFLGE